MTEPKEETIYISGSTASGVGHHGGGAGGPYMPYGITISPMITISRSAERTINPKNYVKGIEFESKKVSAFRSIQIPADTSPSDQASISEKLHATVEAEVELAERNYIDKLTREAGGTPGLITAEELKVISGFVERIIKGDDMELIAQGINDVKDKLSEKQIEFMRNVTRAFRKDQDGKIT